MIYYYFKSMNTVEKIEESLIKKEMPELRPGYVVKIHQKIKEVVGGTADERAAKKAVKSGKKEEVKERIQVFEGIIIGMKGSKKSLNATITVRKISNGIGVERIMPLYLPSIEKIEVVKKTKVRRAKLYYLRERTGKAARISEFKAIDVNDKKQEVKTASEEKTKPVEKNVK